MATTSRLTGLFWIPQAPCSTSKPIASVSFISKFSRPIPFFKSLTVDLSNRYTRLSCNCASTTNYEFQDASSEVELRLPLGSQDFKSSRDIFVDANGASLIVRLNNGLGSSKTLIETNHLFDKIKSTETIWYIDDDQLVINLKKQDPDLKWPDIVESWESLTAGAMQLLKGTSVFIVGHSTDVNQKVARELAVGLGYTPLHTRS